MINVQMQGSVLLIMKLLRCLNGNPTSGSRNELAAVLNGMMNLSEDRMISATQTLSEAIMDNYVAKHIMPGLAMPRLLNATYSYDESRMVTLNIPTVNPLGKIDLQHFVSVRIESSHAQYRITVMGSWSDIDHIAFGLKHTQADMRVIFDYDKEISINALAVIATLERAGLAWQPYCDQSQDRML